MSEETTSVPALIIPGITDESALACIARSRKLSQFIRMVQDALDGICRFCNVDREYNKIVAENEFWYAWPCNPPEKNTKFHFLFVPKRHVTDSEELTKGELSALWGKDGIRAEVRQQFGYTSRGTLMRDGDPRLSAGTIEHLHVHDMVPNGRGRVESPFFKGLESELEGIARAIIFERLRQGANFENLSLLEQELVKDRLD